MCEATHTPKRVFCFCQREEESAVYWPSKDQPLSIDGFAVSLSGDEHVCLSNDERLLVQDFTVQSPQVTHNIIFYINVFMQFKSEALNLLFHLHPSRTIMCWKCGSTAPPAGPTQTVRSETALSSLTRSESRADTHWDQ